MNVRCCEGDLDGGTPHTVSCAAVKVALAEVEALEQELAPQHVTMRCQPAQSNMTSEERGRTDVTSARNIVARYVSAGPGPAEHPPSRRTTLPTSPGPVSRDVLAARPKSKVGRLAMLSSIGGLRTSYESSMARLARCESSQRAAEGVRQVNPCISMSPPRCSMLLKG